MMAGNAFKRAQIRRFGEVVGLCAALCWLVISARFGTVALSELGSWKQLGLAAPAEPAFEAKRAGETTTWNPPQEPPRSSNGEASAHQDSASVSLRIPIVISSKDERAQVRINGTSVGRSPYLGEVTCKHGESIKVELLPTNKVPRGYSYRCLPGEIRVLER